MRTVRSIVVIISVAIIGIALALAISLEWQRPNANAPQRAGQPAPTNSPPPPREPLVPTQTPMIAKTTQLSDASAAPAQPQAGLAPNRIPICTYPLAADRPAPSLKVVSLDAFVFATPRVILTSAHAIALWQYLPDASHVLASRLSASGLGEQIVVFDLLSGLSTVYAERRSSAGKPLWLPVQKSVAFTDSTPPDYIRMLRIASGEKAASQTIITGLASPVLSLSPDSQSIIYTAQMPSGKAQMLRRVSLANSRNTHSAITSIPDHENAGWTFTDAWRNDGNYVVLYGQPGTYLIDARTNDMCEIDMEHDGASKAWPYRVQWSPDGRRLAMLLTRDDGTQPGNLVILHLADGALRSIDLSEQEFTGMVWHPQGAALLATARPSERDRASFETLYLVSLDGHEVRQIFQNQVFFAPGFYGLLWSPNQNQIMFACALAQSPDLVTEWRVCVSDLDESGLGEARP